MSRLEAILSIDLSLHAEQKPLAGNHHASLVYSSYADWPTRARALTARQLPPVVAYTPRVSAADNHTAAIA